MRIGDRVRSIGIELVEDAGLARFLDPHTVALSDGRRWGADRIVIAVGGHPGRLSIPGAELALTYTDIRTLAALPKRVAIVGGRTQVASLVPSLLILAAKFC
jgi:dihydrolipoamide dehydrogenase